MMKCSFRFEPAVNEDVAESQRFLDLLNNVIRLDFLYWTATDEVSTTERKGEEERIEYNEAIFESKIIRKDHLQRRTIVYDGNIYVVTPILPNTFEIVKKKVEKTVEVVAIATAAAAAASTAAVSTTLRSTVGATNELHQFTTTSTSLPAPVVNLTLLDILDYLGEDILVARMVFDKYADCDPDHMTLWSAYLGLLELTGLHVSINELFGIETTTEDAQRNHRFSLTYETFLAHYVRICQSTTEDSPIKNLRPVRKAKEQNKSSIPKVNPESVKNIIPTKPQGIDLSPHVNSSSNIQMSSSYADKESMRRQRCRILEPSFSPTLSLVEETKAEHIEKRQNIKSLTNVNRNQTRFNFSTELTTKAHFMNPKDWFLMVELWEIVMKRTNELLKVDTRSTAGSSSQEPNSDVELQMTAVATGTTLVDTASRKEDETEVEVEVEVEQSSSSILLGTTKLRLLFNTFDVNSMYANNREKEEGNIFVSDWDLFLASALEVSLFVSHQNQPTPKVQSINIKRAHTAWWHVLLNEWRNTVTDVENPNQTSISWQQVIFFLTWLKDKAMNELHSLFKLIARDLYHRIVSDALQMIAPLSRARSIL